MENNPINHPTCAKCGAGHVAPWTHGAPIATTQMQAGPALLAIFFCGNPECGAIHAVQVLEMRQAQPQHSPIVHPGMN